MSALTVDRSTNVLICALGGEGGGVLAEWLVDTARACGHSAQSTSIPGVAQRTGATTYYLEVWPRPDTDLGTRRPVFSLSPVPGELDLLISSELMETVRQIGNGMSRPDRTHVISSDARALTTIEKMQLGDGRVTNETLAALVQRHGRSARLLDMSALAQRNGTVISAVMCGAIAASGVLPFEAEAYRRTIRAAGTGVEASLRGFDAAMQALKPLRGETPTVFDATGGTSTSEAVSAIPPRTSLAPAPASSSSTASLPDALRAFPSSVHATLALGHARVLEYQDAAYARLYAERLQRILAAERAGDPAGVSEFATTRETARHLAVWMAFDDIARVAELKSRAARRARVKREVKAGDDDLVRLYDHFKPGVPEFAALLPPTLGARLARWDARRVARGQAPFALAVKLPTHTIFGALALRGLAALKRVRRFGARYAAEQTLIERWLAAVEHGAREHAALGYELASCGRLIKGYGATHERSRENLLHVIDQLATSGTFETPTARAQAIASARTAALADDAGRKLDQTLVSLGAAPRPIREQPIRWVRKRPGEADARAPLPRDAG